MLKAKLLNTTKKIIEDCCDCHCVDPETEEKTAIGMQLNDEFSIMHYEDSGKVYMFQERDGTAHEMFEVTGSMIMAWQSLFECINETEE